MNQRDCTLRNRGVARRACVSPYRPGFPRSRLPLGCEVCDERREIDRRMEDFVRRLKKLMLMGITSNNALTKFLKRFG